MKKFNDYDDVKVSDFNYEKVEQGPHFCKIIEAKEENVKFNNGSSANILKIKFDFSEKDRQAGLYKRKLENDIKKDIQSAKWKGFFNVYVPKDDGSEQDNKTKEAFKRFITSVEESNEGYKWNWEEATLAGKEVMLIFGLKEFENFAGEIIVFAEPRVPRSIKADIDTIKPLKVKTLNDGYVDYDTYISNGNKGTNSTTNSASSNYNYEGDDDLPF